MVGMKRALIGSLVDDMSELFHEQELQLQILQQLVPQCEGLPRHL